ncbi:MAG: hypothetical protein OWU84_09440 [Firmicutes bacterium]|nr:hypothetical protein [Bacillota bacterium]
MEDWSEAVRASSQLNAAGEVEKVAALWHERLAQGPPTPGLLVVAARELKRAEYRRAARLCLAEALRRDPGCVAAYVEWGHMAREEEDWAVARWAYLQAIDRDPQCVLAHQALAYVYEELGQWEEAQRHRDRGFSAAIWQAPFARPGALRVLEIVSASRGNMPTDSWLQAGPYQVTTVVAEYWRPSRDLGTYDVVVNRVADADAAPLALAQSKAMLRQASCPVLNPPGAIERTARALLPHLVKDLPAVLAAPVARLRSLDVRPWLDAVGWLERGPVLVRAPGFHGGRYLERAGTMAEVQHILARFPEIVLIMPWLDTRRNDGWFRKYRAFIVGEALYPVHAARARHWKVHDFTGARGVESQAEEKAFLTCPAETIGAEHWANLHRLRQRLGLDIGGIDFTVDRDGRLVVFEANAAMTPPAPRGTAERVAAARAIHHALAQLVDTAASHRDNGVTVVSSPP